MSGLIKRDRWKFFCIVQDRVTGKPWISHVDTKPSPGGVCVGQGNGVAILLWNGRFMYGEPIHDKQKTEDRMLYYASLLLDPEKRREILRGL